YMAPEQVRRTIDADARTDVYALGVVIYALLTGRLPHRGATAIDTLVRQIYDSIEPPSSRVSGIAPEIDAVVMRALAKDPDARFQSMAELARALEQLPGAASASITHPLDELVMPALDSTADDSLAIASEGGVDRLLRGSSRAWRFVQWSAAAAATT